VSASRAVRVVTEVAPVDRPFDYAVTDATSHVAPGDRVRVNFNNRSVRGWVTGDVETERELKPLTKWLGYGPPPSLLELLSWASERWCSPLSRFLISTSPKRLVTTLPVPPVRTPLSAPMAAKAVAWRPGVVQLAPTTDPLPLILGAYADALARDGSLVVLVPTEAWARRMRGRLEQRGCRVASGEGEWERMRAGWPVVVGPRGAALAPVPKLAGAVVIDADDEAYRSEAAPTWDAVAVLRERCRRDGAPLWCTSMVPSPSLLDRGGYEKDDDLAGGWPRIEVVDQRLRDPRDGALSREALDAAHRALRAEEPVAVCVVLQRLGTGRLFACKKCGELARCATCALGEEEIHGQLACRDRHELRANYCRSCGATNLKRVRVGVTTLARDVAAQLSQPVSEVTAGSDALAPLARVVVGTEAVWQRVRRCGVVIFVDFDQYLLAPRESARRAAVIAVGKAGRLVGSRREARGEVVLQTRRGEDQVIAALEDASFDAVIEEDVATARLLALAPYGATAAVSGDAASAFVAQLVDPGLSTYQTPDGYVVRAMDVDTLTSALRAAPRPPGKLRIAVE
jgi:primosomal protein N' (replication factor Y)